MAERGYAHLSRAEVLHCLSGQADEWNQRRGPKQHNSLLEGARVLARLALFVDVCLQFCRVWHREAEYVFVRRERCQRTGEIGCYAKRLSVKCERLDLILEPTARLGTEAHICSLSVGEVREWGCLANVANHFLVQQKDPVSNNKVEENWERHPTLISGLHVHI